MSGDLSSNFPGGLERLQEKAARLDPAECWNIGLDNLADMSYLDAIVYFGALEKNPAYAEKIGLALSLANAGACHKGRMDCGMSQRLSYMHAYLVQACRQFDIALKTVPFPYNNQEGCALSSLYFSLVQVYQMRMDEQ